MRAPRRISRRIFLAILEVAKWLVMDLKIDFFVQDGCLKICFLSKMLILRGVAKMLIFGGSPAGVEIGF